MYCENMTQSADGLLNCMRATDKGSCVNSVTQAYTEQADNERNRWEIKKAVGIAESISKKTL